MGESSDKKNLTAKGAKETRRLQRGTRSPGVLCVSLAPFAVKFLSRRRLPFLLTLTVSLLSLTANNHALSQTLKVQKTVPISPPTAFSVNRSGTLFVGDARGAVRAYDTTGRVTHTFSPPRVAEVAALDAGQNLRVFCFYRDLQEYLLLDRFLTPLPGYEKPVRIAPDEVGFARLATLAQDGQLWLFDDTDFSLKKYNPVTRRVSLHVPLELVLAGQDPVFVALREYQNLVFLHDGRSGVLVFDNAGNFRSKIAAEAAGPVGFYGDELYFARDGFIHFVHLYNGTTRRLPLPGGIDVLGVAAGPTAIYLLSRNQLLVCPAPL
jgi:hypothetical protein